jgi:hypothetical protein
MKKKNIVFMGLLALSILIGSMEARRRRGGHGGNRGHRSHRGHRRGHGWSRGSSFLGGLFGSLLYKSAYSNEVLRESRSHYESFHGRCPYCVNRPMHASPRMLKEHIWYGHRERFYDSYRGW